MSLYSLKCLVAAMACLTGPLERYRNMASSEIAMTCLWCEVSRSHWSGASTPAQCARNAAMLWGFQNAAVCQVIIYS